MFRAIGAFLRTLWRISMFWRIPPFEDASAGVRVGSPLGGGLMFLFLLFFIIAFIVVVVGSIFGLTVEDTLGGIDAWLGQNGSMLDFIGKLALKIILVIVLALSVFFAITALRDRFRRKGRERPGWLKTIGILLLCLMLGYCSAVNIVAPFERYDPTLGSQYMD